LTPRRHGSEAGSPRERACSYDEHVATNVSPAGDASAAGGSGGSPARTSAAARLTAFFWRPTRRSMRTLALAGVVVNAGIIVTGAAVRLSKSGLGCPDWPDCTTKSLVATHTPGQTIVNTWIEFGNRLLTFVVMAVAVAVFIAAWRLRLPGRDGRPVRRTDLVWLAAAQPASVVLQAVLGGITVLTALNPAMVSVHFLVSMAIVAVAVVLYVRCGEDVTPPRPLARADLRVLSAMVLVIAGLMLAAGTVVTGTGPLAGNAAAPRYHLPLQAVTQLHADIGWLFGGLALTLAVGLKLTDAMPRSIRLGWVLLGLLAAQGALGYIQYFTGLPPLLVGMHVLGAVLIWITALLLFFSLRDRGSIAPAEQAPAAPAETAPSTAAHAPAATAAHAPSTAAHAPATAEHSTADQAAVPADTKALARTQESREVARARGMPPAG
jgi:heme a synthase